MIPPRFDTAKNRPKVDQEKSRKMQTGLGSCKICRTQGGVNMFMRRDVTELLQAWNRGEKVLDELMPLVYEELRRAASHYLRQEPPWSHLAADRSRRRVGSPHHGRIGAKKGWRGRRRNSSIGGGDLAARHRRRAEPSACDWL
jgi:hypothetical protein